MAKKPSLDAALETARKKAKAGKVYLVCSNGKKEHTIHLLPNDIIFARVIDGRKKPAKNLKGA